MPPIRFEAADGPGYGFGGGTGCHQIVSRIWTGATLSERR